MSDVVGPEKKTADAKYQRVVELASRGDVEAGERLYVEATRRRDMAGRLLGLVAWRGPVEYVNALGLFADHFTQDEIPSLMAAYQDLVESGALYLSRHAIVVPSDVPSMSVEDLKKFVLGWADGQIFTDRHIHANNGQLTTLIFMALKFLDVKTIRTDSVALIWEWMSEAQARSVNGYPTFFSCHMMNHADWERARVAIEAEIKRREEMVI